jgi:hypothetical protein
LCAIAENCSERASAAVEGRRDERADIGYKPVMAAKNLDHIIERLRHWPEERQQDAAATLLEMERQDASDYRLTDAQAEEVAQIQHEFIDGRGRLATDEQMAELWTSCGL